MKKPGGRWTKARRALQSRIIREYSAAHPELRVRGPMPAGFGARKSAAMRALWANPEYRAMMHAAKTAGWTQQRRYAWSLRQQAALASSGTRERMSRSAKAKWARRKSTVVDAQDARGRVRGPGGSRLSGGPDEAVQRHVAGACGPGEE